jgi:hypothetical protein
MVQEDLKGSVTRRGCGGNVTHYSWDSELPVVEAEVHDRFRVPTHDTAASIRGETIEYGSANVLVSGRATGVRDGSEATITQTLFVNGSSFTFYAFRKQLEELLGVLVFTRA